MGRHARKVITMACSIFLSLVLIFMQGCREHEIVYPLNEEELITTVTLTFAKLDEQGIPTGESSTFSWRDEDGSGDPEIDEIVLSAHTQYSLSLEILDESKSPPEDITSEIRAEGEEHQFFFSVEGTELVITYDDSDEGGQPIGLSSKATTEEGGTGSLTVVLRHQPDKNAEGVENGEIANAGGDTDIEAKFQLTVAP